MVAASSISGDISGSGVMIGPNSQNVGGIDDCRHEMYFGALLADPHGQHSHTEDRREHLSIAPENPLCPPL
ncbi:MAG: hypothetical protein ACOX8D_08865 [Methanoculleus sp.]|nr:hypothetical protein [Methanomicrobiales archaeon]